MAGSKNAVIMSKTRPNILYAAVGIHPHFVKDDWNDKNQEALEELVRLREVVAVGECGLDYNRLYSPKELQESAFKKQVNFNLHFMLIVIYHVVFQVNISILIVTFFSSSSLFFIFRITRSNLL